MFRFFKKNEKEQKSPKEILAYLRKLDKDIQKLSGDLENFKEKSKKTLQKVGIVRFNPFKETGGDQSFSIAVLNASNDGFVITSHYGREANRVYAKPIKNGQSQYQLSNEEKKAIEEAIKKD